jgi:formate dehydrogenase maturation protein FdhE
MMCPKCGSEIDERMWYLADDSEGIRRRFADCDVCGHSQKVG